MGTDYLSEGLRESPLLHFWSLAVEEQFYLVWPGLLVLLVRFARLSRKALAAVIGVMWLVSFIACVKLTHDSQPWAFFMLPTRAWELLTGAGLALAGGQVLRSNRHLAGVLGWVGVAVIGVVSVAFSITTSFPGYAALLPVVAHRAHHQRRHAAQRAGDGPEGEAAAMDRRPLVRDLPVALPDARARRGQVGHQRRGRLAARRHSNRAAGWLVRSCCAELSTSSRTPFATRRSLGACHCAAW